MIDKSYTVPNYWSNIQYTNNMTRGVYNIYICLHYATPFGMLGRRQASAPHLVWEGGPFDPKSFVPTWLTNSYHRFTLPSVCESMFALRNTFWNAR